MIKLEKNRYLAIKIDESFLNESITFKAIQNSILKLFGEYGASKAKIKLIKYIPKDQQIIICCSHKMLEKVRASIASILEIEKKPITLHVLNVSGTLKSLNHKLKK